MLPSKKTLLLLVIALISIGLVAGCGGKKAEEKTINQPNESQAENGGEHKVPNFSLGVDPDTEIAVYEGGNVTAGEFEKYLAIQSFVNPQYNLAINDPSYRRIFLDGYLGEIILASRINEEKRAREEAEKMYDEAVKTYTSLMGSKEKVDQLLTQLNITSNDVIDYYTRYKEVEYYLDKQVTNEAIEKSYQDNQGAYTVATVRQILIAFEGKKKEEALKIAEDIAKRIRNGEDMAVLAKEYSDDPGSKDNGGLYSNVRVTEWVPEFKAAALSLPIGKISDPVETTYGYHIMKVEERRVLPLEDVREEVKVDIMNQVYNQFVTKELNSLVKEVKLPAEKK
ncbi:peptidylprolyl isomerase [Microaerobacter geothermalis]|uniref:peptidylprolyl isomerase n=1 Tax=Microaerobacter geothermalis TaxID=674972 RepID=UPI001F3D3C0B|nr:peptidylprolyl isomerase [Microaerobacter geothermalis]MCF6094696.1 peptidylprolyl isomerase [Microaerobacter geothermalis]